MTKGKRKVGTAGPLARGAFSKRRVRRVACAPPLAGGDKSLSKSTFFNLGRVFARPPGGARKRRARATRAIPIKEKAM